MPFEITPAETAPSALELTAQPDTPSAADGRMGRFVQIRLNGEDVGDDRVEVLDFIAPAGRG